MTDDGNLTTRYPRVAPEEIEATSFEIIRRSLPMLPLNEREMQVLLRIVHTTGDLGIAEHVKIHPAAVDSGIVAIRAGVPIVVDVKMVASGINGVLVRKYGSQVRCAIDDPGVIALAKEKGITRAAAAMHWLKDALNGSIVAIGNAPTALFALFDLMYAGGIRPALIVGTPVGFVGAAEAKAELLRWDIPYITVEGTRGGSAIAVATVNALLKQGG